MPVIYTPNLTLGPGKVVGTSLSSGQIDDQIRELRGNDRTRPYMSSASLPVTLYFQIHDANDDPQTFNHVYLLAENVDTIQLRAGAIADVATSANLYTPGPTTGIGLNSADGRESGTNRKVFKLDVTGSGTTVELRITAKEESAHPFYIYAFYLMNDRLLTIRNDDETSFSSYSIASVPRGAVEQIDLYGDVTYQPGVNRASKRGVNYTVWYVADQFRTTDNRINELVRIKDSNPNIVFDEDIFTTINSSGDTVFHGDSNDLEATYPAYWVPGVSQNIEAQGVKSVTFGVQES